MKELIRHILKEETKLPAFIRRRIPADVMENEFKDSLKSALAMVKRQDYNRTYQEIREHIVWVTISMLIDSIHYQLYSTLPEDIQWWDDVFKILEKHYRSRIIKVFMEHFRL